MAIHRGSHAGRQFGVNPPAVWSSGYTDGRSHCAPARLHAPGVGGSRGSSLLGDAGRGRTGPDARRPWPLSEFDSSVLRLSGCGRLSGRRWVAVHLTLGASASGVQVRVLGPGRRFCVASQADGFVAVTKRRAFPGSSAAWPSGCARPRCSLTACRERAITTSSLDEVAPSGRLSVYRGRQRGQASVGSGWGRGCRLRRTWGRRKEAARIAAAASPRLVLKGRRQVRGMHARARRPFERPRGRPSGSNPMDADGAEGGPVRGLRTERASSPRRPTRCEPRLRDA